MTWWMWIIAGLGLFLLELLSPGGFYLFFFALGAVLAGLVAGMVPDAPPWLNILVFVLSSLAFLLIFRRRLIDRFQRAMPKGTLDHFAEEIATALEDLEPGAVGKAELRGSPWTAKNSGSEPLRKGQRCKVVKLEGLTVWLRPE